MRKYPPDPGHGVYDLLEALDMLPETVNVGAQTGSAPTSQADFDRAVRKSMDRLHRKQMIAER